MPRRRQNEDTALQTQALLTEEEGLAQLQQATQESSAPNSPIANPNNAIAAATSATPPTDGARRPIAPGVDYASLRLLTRRQPIDPYAVINGQDISNADLSWNSRYESQSLDPNGNPWKYPKKRGKGEGSNLEQFKDEIEEMTKNGQGCKAISDILIERGVDTSSRAVSRARMKWGLRQRAKRKMTEQGLANIRRAHLEHAKRMANNDPVPVKRVRIRVMRKAEIIRMSKEGMSSAEIAENLMSRGVHLRRGEATVERLRTIWGLDGSERSVINIRATARNRALKNQREQFENIARELGIEDVEAWVKSKMEEPVAYEARRVYAEELMGDAKPKPSTEGQRRGIEEYQKKLRAKKLREQQGNVMTQMSGVDLVPNAQGSDQPEDQQGQQARLEGSMSVEGSPDGTAREIVELSSDEHDDDDDDDTEDELMDVEGGDLDENGVRGVSRGESEVAGGEASVVKMEEVDDLSISQQQSSVEAQRNTASVMEVDLTAPMDEQQPPSNDSNVSQNGGLLPFPSLAPNQNLQPQHAQVPPQSQPKATGIFHSPRGTNVIFTEPQAQPPPPRPIPTVAPPAGLPGRPALANIAPRPLAPRTLAPRPAMPLQMQGAHSVEADYMRQFGLFPYATQGKAPQRYLTPSGLIVTDGYEYLPKPPMTSATYPPQTAPIVGHPYNHQQPPPADVILVGTPAQPVPPLPPPEPLVTKIPAPPLVMADEEVEKHKGDFRLVEPCYRAAKECADMLTARAKNQPMAGSLTGLPPSLKDIQTAKEQLKELAMEIVAML